MCPSALRGLGLGGWDPLLDEGLCWDPGARLVSSVGTVSPGPTWVLEEQLAVMNTQFNRRVLIDLFIWNDDQNSSRHIIYV